MTKTRILFILIIILSIALRIFYLGKIPNGFYSDEAAYGYNAYSILTTGADEYGNFLPLAFKSFGDFKTPLYIYFLVPFVKVLGLTEFAIRASAVVLGIATIFLIYVLVQELFKNQTLALLSSFIASVLPFSLQFNRMAHENNLVVFLVLCGLFFFLKSLKNSNFIFIAAAAFALSIYTYHDARIFTPLFILSLVFIYRQKLKTFTKKVVVGFLLFIIILLPFINLLRSEAFWSRPKFTIISSDIGISLRINEERGEDIKSLFFAPALFHNKIISYGTTFIDNYMKHFAFDFLFLRGEAVKIYQTIGSGLIYLIFFPFIIYGFYYIFRHNLDNRWLIFSWIVLVPVPSALTRFVPAASRILSIYPVFAILIALGLFVSLKSFNWSSGKKIYSMLVAFLFAINTAYYLHYYYFNTNIRYAKEWHYGMKEVLGEVEKRQNKYSQVWFSKSAWGYIYPLFYLKYPPEKYQKQAKLTDLNEFGFGWVERFDRYVFADIPDKFILDMNTLYVSSPEDRIAIDNPLSTIYYPNGEVAFYIFDKNSLK